MACRDDVRDEEKFKYLNLFKKQNKIKEESIKKITWILNKKPSVTKYYVPFPEELLLILKQLIILILSIKIINNYNS